MADALTPSGSDSNLYNGHSFQQLSASSRIEAPQPVRPFHGPDCPSGLSHVEYNAVVEYTAGRNGAEQSEQSDSDVYRGEPPPSPAIGLVAADKGSVASSSSSSSLNVGRRFGALANAVEAAITRWARINSSASSISSSSSVSSASRTRRRRGRCYSGTASIHNAAHERAFMERRKAQEEFRAVPREFTLLLPSEATTTHTRRVKSLHAQEMESAVIQTTSLPSILAHLDSALKKSAKWRRAMERLTSSGASSGRTAAKGKAKAASGKSDGATKGSASSSKATEGDAPAKSWWLDVASPSWEDLRSIGKLLHLHPLTLEDILHRDPREKLELFPGLGYYFLMFRALEGDRSRERFRRFKSSKLDALPSTSADEGVVGAVNVYVIVFTEGICTFHFKDISEHTDKLRYKILQMERSFAMTSDWIAHGLMDSIVDSFFPILTSIDKEVKEVDSLVLGDPFTLRSTPTTDTQLIDTKPLEREKSFDEKAPYIPTSITLGDKGVSKETTSSVFSSPIYLLRFHLTLLRALKGAARNIIPKQKGKENAGRTEPINSTPKTLLRMAAVRRIVTSVGRLLGTKGEVVAQLRKRLIEANKANLGLDGSTVGEVAIYMGDIQDHIITLQQSLNHYERMLSHSHPTYLSQLRVRQSDARGGTDKAVLALTLVSVTVYTIQVLLGLFSLNVHVPNNKHSKAHPFALFLAVLGGCFMVGFSVISTVRYWYSEAKKKYSRRSLLAYT